MPPFIFIKDDLLLLFSFSEIFLEVIYLNNSFDILRMLLYLLLLSMVNFTYVPIDDFVNQTHIETTPIYADLEHPSLESIHSVTIPIDDYLSGHRGLVSPEGIIPDITKHEDDPEYEEDSDLDEPPPLDLVVDEDDQIDDDYDELPPKEELDPEMDELPKPDNSKSGSPRIHLYFDPSKLKETHRYVVKTKDSIQVFEGSLEELPKYLDSDADVYLDLKMKVALEDVKGITGWTNLTSNLSLSGANLGVCIVDSGVSDLDYVIRGPDFVDGGNVSGDPLGHGTLMAKIVHSLSPNSTIVSVRVLDDQGAGYSSTVMQGIDWCVENRDTYNISVILLAFGGGSFEGYCSNDLLAGPISNAVDNGVVVIAAAGNDGDNKLPSPACVPEAISVGSTDKDDQLSSFTNVNYYLELLAPGEDVSVDGSSYSGTSVSSAVVAGLTPLLLEHNSSLTPLDVEALFRGSGEPINYNNLTIPRVNVYSAIYNPQFDYVNYSSSDNTNYSGNYSPYLTYIYTCQDITSPDNYVLANDLTGVQSGRNYCIRILSDDVDLNCNGRSITNDDPSVSRYGIYIYSSGDRRGVSVHDCNIVRYSRGIYARAGGNLEKTSIYGNEISFGASSQYLVGIYVYSRYITGLYIEKNYIYKGATTSSAIGVYIYPYYDDKEILLGGNIVEGLEAQYSAIGLRFYSYYGVFNGLTVDGNTIRDLSSDSSSSYGIYYYTAPTASESSYITFTNNQISDIYSGTSYDYAYGIYARSRGGFNDLEITSNDLNVIHSRSYRARGINIESDRDLRNSYMDGNTMYNISADSTSLAIGLRIRLAGDDSSIRSSVLQSSVNFVKTYGNGTGRGWDIYVRRNITDSEILNSHISNVYSNGTNAVYGIMLNYYNGTIEGLNIDSVQIEDIYAEDGTANGIRIYSGDTSEGYGIHDLVVNNTYLNNIVSGYSSDNSYGLRLQGEYFGSATIDNTKVNSILSRSTSAAYGIRFYNYFTDVPVENLTLLNTNVSNVESVDGSAYGISITHPSISNISANNLEFNNLTAVGSNDYSIALYLSGSSNITDLNLNNILGDNFTSQRSAGLYVYSSSCQNIANLNVSNSLFSNIWNTGDYSYGYYVYCGSAGIVENLYFYNASVSYFGTNSTGSAYGYYFNDQGKLVNSIIEQAKVSHGISNYSSYCAAITLRPESLYNVSILNSYITNYTYLTGVTRGIFVRTRSTSSSIDLLNISNNTVVNLYALDTATGLAGIYGYVHGNQYSEISNNYVGNLSSHRYVYGIRYRGDSDAILNLNVRNNTIYNLSSNVGRSSGVYLSDTSSTYGSIYDVNVTNNRISKIYPGTTSDYSTGVYIYGYLDLNNIRVINNSISDSEGNYYVVGVYSYTSGPASYLLYLNNSIYNLSATGSTGNVYGIYLYASDSADSMLNNSRFDGNDFYDLKSQSTTEYASYLSAQLDWSNVSISNNSVHNLTASNSNTRTLFYLYSPSYLVNSNISNNKFYNLDLSSALLYSVRILQSTSDSINYTYLQDNTFSNISSNSDVYGIHLTSGGIYQMNFSANLTNISSGGSLFGMYHYSNGFIDQFTQHYSNFQNCSSSDMAGVLYLRSASGQPITNLNIYNSQASNIDGDYVYLYEILSDNLIDYAEIYNLSAENIVGNSGMSAVTINEGGRLSRMIFKNFSGINLTSSGDLPLVYLYSSSQSGKLVFQNFSLVNSSGANYVASVVLSTDTLDSINGENLTFHNLTSSSGFAEGIYIYSPNGGDTLEFQQINGSLFDSDNEYGGCIYIYSDSLSNAYIRDVNCTGGARHVHYTGLTVGDFRNYRLWNSTDYSLFLDNVDTSTFDNVFIYNTSRYLAYSSTSSSANSFTDLTLGYDDRFGLINWSSVSMDFVIANSSYLLLDPYFVSLDAWEFNIVQLNEDADITLRSEGCPYDVYRDTDFPQSREEIIRDGSIVDPVTKICSPPFAIFSTVNKFDSAAGYAIYSCFTINQSGEYSLLGSLAGNKTDGACITINASNVQLNCSGHNITGNTPGTTGVWIDNVDNVDVFNCTILNYSIGLHYNNSDNSHAYNDTIYNCSNGFLGFSSFNLNFTNSTVYNSTNCVIFNSTDSPALKYLSISNCSYGVLLSGVSPLVDSISVLSSDYGLNSSADSLKLYNSTITNNTLLGVNLSGSNIELRNNDLCFNLMDIYNASSSAEGSLDRCYYWENWWENGHKGCEFSCFDVWHIFFGFWDGHIKLGQSQTNIMMDWLANSGYVYAYSSSDSPSWLSLKALGRTASDTPASNDFTEADVLMGTTGAWDSITNTFSTDGSNPIETRDIYFMNHTITYVPISNTTNNSITWTGILWDSSMDTNGEFDNTDNEALVFIANVSSSNLDCKYGSCTFEIKVPGTFDTYRGDPTGVVYFYVELH